MLPRLNPSRTLSPRFDAPDPAPPPSFGADVSPQEELANAAEELTFQFSEQVEASGNILDEQFDPHSGHEDEHASVEEVAAMLRLMAGRDGFDRIRGQARLFAQAFSRGRPDAMSLLSPQAFKPHERYALLRLASDALMGDASGRLQQAARQMLDEHSEQLRGLFDVLPALRRAPAAPAGELPGEAARYFQLLATKPTVRTVLDAVAEMGGANDAGAALSRMQRDWSKYLGHLEQIGTFIAVSRLSGAVRTMVEHGRELADYPGAVNRSDPAMPFRHARAMIDIANSAVPGGLLDKLVAAVLGQSAQRERQLSLLSYLHRLVRRWPDMVWATPDGRALVLQQLVRKQRD